jgi:hypothetical protein
MLQMLRDKTNIAVLLIISWLAGLVIGGCVGLKKEPAGLSDEQVAQVTDRVLQAINTGSYPNFTRDFSDQMKQAFTMDQFNQLHDLLQKTSGKYISLMPKPEMANNQGHAIYSFSCKFEQESVLATLTFKIGGDKVEGLFFDSQNLRKQTQSK